jgi:hypothetical protein
MTKQNEPRGWCDKRLIGASTAVILTRRPECGLKDARECKVHAPILKAAERALLEREWDSVTTH